MDSQAAKQELLQFRSQLLALDQEESERLATSLEEEADEETYDQHIADVGAVTLDREMELSLQGNTERLLEQVNRALEKIEEGTYGLCDRCGQPIEEGRLEAVPYATLCIRHQRELERSPEPL
jgi:RNA polymerase-binding protein DksA